MSSTDSVDAATAIRFGAKKMTAQDVAQYIDSTKLTYKLGEDPQSTILDLCKEAVENRFFAVCVRPNMVTLAKEAVKSSDVKVATVIGFPVDKSKLADQTSWATVGDFSLQDKIKEAEQAIQDGADELDLVMNVRQFLSEAEQPQQVATVNEFKAIKVVAGKKLLKVILETDLLTPAQIQKATKACIEAGVDIVKTSTGMLDGGVGATVENVKRIHQTLVDAGMENKMGIKASGGIKNAEGAIALIEAGATRLGTSSGLAIVNGLTTQGGY